MTQPADNLKPRVSVVIPTYNRQDMVVPTVRSVCDQTFQQWECIVVDDGSTDHTREVVEELCAEDPRIRYVWQENTSAAAARNHGIELARGEYVAFLDSDDLYTPDRLAWQVDALDADPGAVIVYGDTYKFYHDAPSDGFLYCQDVDPMPQGDAFEALLCNSSIYSPMIRTEAIRAAGGFDTTMPSAEDWEMWVTLAKTGRVLYEPRVALRYRIHRGNKSGNTLRNYRCALYVIRKHTRQLPWRERRRLRRQACQYLRQGYTHRLLDDAHALAKAGKRRQAMESLRAVTQLNPWAALRRVSKDAARLFAGKLLAAPIRLAERLVDSPRGLQMLVRDMPEPGGEIALATLRTILVLRQDEIGDMVMTSAFFRELRANAPAATIIVITSPLAATLLEPCPYVDEIIPLRWNDRGRLGRFRRYRQARRLAAEQLQPRKIDLAIIPRFDADDHYATALAYLSGARHRVAWSESSTPTKHRRNRHYDTLLTRAIRDRASHHDAVRNLDLIRHLGGRVTSERLELWMSDEDRAIIRERLARHDLPDSRPLIAIAPGAGHPKRQWPIDRFAELAQWLVREQGCRVIIIGGPGEEPLGRAIRGDEHHAIIDLVGQCTLRQTAALFEHCDLFIGNDSGPMHMAAAAGLPVVDLSCHPAGASQDHVNSPRRFGPWGVPAIILQPPAPLSPCGDGCEAAEAHCIRQISPTTVYEAAARLLPTLHTTPS